MALARIASADTNTRHAVFFNLALCIADNLFDFGDLVGCGGQGVAFDADCVVAVLGGVKEELFLEADDHAGEVVGAEPGEGVLDEELGGGVGVLDVADQVDGFLVLADIPQLLQRVS